MKIRIVMTDDDGTVLELAEIQAEFGSRQVMDYLQKATTNRDGFETVDEEIG